MTRKDVVRIVHEFLRTELREPDEIDITPAYILQDLFDCRVCAGHIMQVYVKGIMDGVTLPDGRMIFDTEKKVSPEEWTEIMSRVCFSEFRVPRKTESCKTNLREAPEQLSPEQAMEFLQVAEKILLVDVRSVRDYEAGHQEGSLNVPLLDIIKNPFVFSGNRDKMILLYCEEGVQSQAAAGCLKEAGYKNVAYFAWKESRLSEGEKV